MVRNFLALLVSGPEEADDIWYHTEILSLHSLFLPEAWLVGPVARPGPDPQVASPKAHAWRKAPSSLFCLSLLSIVESRYNKMDGQMEGRTDGRLDGWTKFFPILQDFVPNWSRCQKS